MKVARSILQHSLIWICFLGVQYIFKPGPGLVKWPDLTDATELASFILYLLLGAFFYANYYYLAPTYYPQKKIGIYLLTIALSLSVIIAIQKSQNHTVKGTTDTNKNTNKISKTFPIERGKMPPIEVVLFLFASGFFSSLFLWLANYTRQMERDKIQAELSVLKLQIHPHFLFNTLNSIYALILQGDPKAADSIVMLSDFLRYVIRETHDSTVPLQKELTFIDNYIELHRNRLQNTVNILYTRSDAHEHLHIVPLILFSLVENAFKHGVSPVEKSEIDISIHISATHHLSLRVRNLKVHNIHAADNHDGIGIANTRNRLAMLYPNRHTLHIDDQAHSFTVKLELQLS